MNSYIWIIDDDESITDILKDSLENLNYRTNSFNDSRRILFPIKPEDLPNLVLCDISMEEKNTGIQLLQKFQKHHTDIPIIMMSAYTNMENTLSSFSKGAIEYITKPFDLNELTTLVANILNNNADNSPPLSDPPYISTKTSPIVGESIVMQPLFRSIAKLANSNVTAFISGASGTGKELIAQAIHENGQKKNSSIYRP